MTVDTQKLAIGLAAFGTVATAGWLYFFAPTEHAFYPRCVFHTLTGLACPGCGSLRAVHSLLHREVVTAFRFNPLLLTVLPVAAIASVVRRFLGLKPANPFWIWLLLAVIVGFSILRNLPVSPFNYFKP